MAKIYVLHNADFGDDGAPDATSVAESAGAVAAALTESGHRVELVGVVGADAFATLARVHAGAPDLVFNLCESLGGSAANEPTFAGMLELFGLRYTGSDLVTLAVCLHKQRTKDLLRAHAVSTPDYRYFASERELAEPAVDALAFPYFVKLAHEDASVGITGANVVRDAAELRGRAAELMHAHRQGVLAERFVDGREVNVTLLGGRDEQMVLPLHEIDFGAMPADRPKIVTYAAKWEPEHVEYAGTTSVPLHGAGADVIAAIERVARATWRAVGLRDYGRVDLRVDAAGVPWVIDVNPNPDISPDAGVVKAAAAAGMSHRALIAKIADLALAR